jgi:hypothetical protein
LSTLSKYGSAFFGRKWLYRGRIGWTLLIAALIASWIDFGRLNEFRNSDSFVLVLASLEKWTPFFWGQNRLGMLIPLLASPISSPFANLLFQTWLGTFAGLLASFLLVRYLVGDRVSWSLAGALVNLSAMYVLPLQVQCYWFAAQPYAVSLALGLSAFILLEKGSVLRWALAILLVLLAHWVNVAVFTILAALAVVHYVLEKQQSYLTRVLACLSLGALGGWLVLRVFSPYRNTPEGLIRPAEWPSAWAQLLHTTLFGWTGGGGDETMVPHPFQLLWLAIPAVVAIIVLLVTPSLQPKRYFQIAATLAAVGLINWLFTGTLIWVRLNSYAPRYTYPALLCGLAALAILEVPVLEKTLGSKWALRIVTVLMLVTVGFRYGPPSITQVRRALDQHYGHMTGEILATRAMVLAGDYWTVWPAVFHANLVLYERGEHEIIYGLTNRSDVTNPLWADVPPDQLCVAAPVRDIGPPEYQEAVLYMTGAGIHFPRIERYDTLDIFELGDQSRCNRYSQRDPRWFRRASAILAAGMRQLLKTVLIELHLESISESKSLSSSGWIR